MGFYVDNDFTEQQYESVMALIAALRSGDYEQGDGLLRASNDKFCCLGVACDIYDSSRWGPMQPVSRHFDALDGGYDSHTVLPSDLVDVYGFYNVDGSAHDPLTGMMRLDLSGLTQLNDMLVPFGVIADLLDADVHGHLTERHICDVRDRYREQA